jgi:hypothetical protein
MIRNAWDPLAGAMMAEREEDVCRCLLAREVRVTRAAAPEPAGASRPRGRLLVLLHGFAVLCRLAQLPPLQRGP